MDIAGITTRGDCLAQLHIGLLAAVRSFLFFLFLLLQPLSHHISGVPASPPVHASLPAGNLLPWTGVLALLHAEEILRLEANVPSMQSAGAAVRYGS